MSVAAAVRLAIYAASYDGRWYGRYPYGNAPQPPLVAYAYGKAASTATITAGAGTLQFVTASLPTAIVGQTYSAQLQVTGGTGNYIYWASSAAPNLGLWHSCSPTGSVSGVPQRVPLAGYDTVTYNVLDLSTSATASTTLTIPTVSSGALSFVTGATLPTAYQGGYYAAQIVVQGGVPPYQHSTSGLSQPWWLGKNGWVYGAPNSTTTQTFADTVTDATGATITQTFTIPGAANTFHISGVDTIKSRINVPPGRVGAPFQWTPITYGGTQSGITWMKGSGALPAGLSFNTSSGQIGGTPTTPGTYIWQMHASDNGGNVTGSVTFAMTVLASQTASRPGYNTGTGAFVAGGRLYDWTGNEARLRGMDRCHFDSQSWAGGTAGGLSGANSTRVFMFEGMSAVNAVAQCEQQYLPASAGGSSGNAVLPVLALAYASQIGTTGIQSPMLLGYAMADWLSYASELSTIQKYLVLNLANEWGPADSTVWRDAYKYVTSPLTSIASSTLTINSAASSNPFATTPLGLIKGASGISDQVVLLTSQGGSQGAWTAVASAPSSLQIGSGNGSTVTFSATLTAPVAPGAVLVTTNNGGQWAVDNGSGSLVTGNGVSAGTINYSTGAVSVTFNSAPGNGVAIWAVYGVKISGSASGGTLYGGAVGVMRGEGILCPLLIDAGGSGQDTADIINYAAAIQSSDPQQNCLFAYHAYNSADELSFGVRSVQSSGTNTIVTLNTTSAWATHPFGSGYPPNTWNGATSYYLSAIQGMTQLNGFQPCSANNLGGSQGAWTITLQVDSSSWPAYTGGGVIARGSHFELMLGALGSTLRSSNVCVIAAEFGPPTPPLSVWYDQTGMTVEDVICACEANQIGWMYWAWDDNNASGNQCDWQGFFGMTGTTGSSFTNGQFTGDPATFTAMGLEIWGNPRWGLRALPSPVPGFV